VRHRLLVGAQCKPVIRPRAPLTSRTPQEMGEEDQDGAWPSLRLYASPQKDEAPAPTRDAGVSVCMLDCIASGGNHVNPRGDSLPACRTFSKGRIWVSLGLSVRAM